MLLALGIGAGACGTAADRSLTASTSLAPTVEPAASVTSMLLTSSATTDVATSTSPSTVNMTTAPASSQPTGLGPPVGTDFVVDLSILTYLDGSLLVTKAPTEFGGAYYDAAAGRAIVFYSASVDPAVAEADIRRYVTDSITWLDHSVVNVNNVPVTTAIAPSLPLVLIASALTYKDYADLGLI